MRNTAPHQKWLSMIPPMIGPMTNPAAKVAANIPIARARCAASGNSSLMTARHDGRSVAPPSPMRVRAPIRNPGEGANAPHTEETPNTAAPARRSFLRPNRSPRFPKATRREPTTNP